MIIVLGALIGIVAGSIIGGAGVYLIAKKVIPKEFKKIVDKAVQDAKR